MCAVWCAITAENFVCHLTCSPFHLAGSPWETNSKKAPVKKAPAPKGKRTDGPRDGPRDYSDRPRSARPANDKPQRNVHKGKGIKPGSPTNVADAITAAAPALVKAAPAAQRSVPLPAAAPSSLPSSPPAVTGNQWARGPPRPKQPVQEMPVIVVPPAVAEPTEQEPAAPAVNAPAVSAPWSTHQKSKTHATQAPAPAQAPAQAPTPPVPETIAAHQSVPSPVEQVPATPADSQAHVQYQHVDAAPSMASLSLESTFSTPANADMTTYGGYGYHDGTTQDSSMLSANTFGKSNASTMNDPSQYPPSAVPQMQSMYGFLGIDAGSATTSTGAIGYNPLLSQQQNLTSTFGMGQDLSTTATDNGQQSLMYQQQWLNQMMNYGGFAGPYGNMPAMYNQNMAAMYNPNMASMSSAMYGGPGFMGKNPGMPNMGFGGMSNAMSSNAMSSGNSTGYTAPKNSNHNSRKHHNSSYGNAGYVSHAVAPTNIDSSSASAYGNSSINSNMYSGNQFMAGMQSKPSDVGLGQGYGQPYQQGYGQSSYQQTQQSFGNMGANSRYNATQYSRAEASWGN